MLAIETNKLTKKFKEKTAVNEINLKINEGELFALLGTNGAGKTTLIKLLNDLLSYQISLGYRGLYNGSMEKTYKKKGIKSLYESFDYSEEIPTQEKVRYGLPIDSDTRKRVLKKEFKI